MSKLTKTLSKRESPTPLLGKVLTVALALLIPTLVYNHTPLADIITKEEHVHIGDYEVDYKGRYEAETGSAFGTTEHYLVYNIKGTNDVTQAIQLGISSREYYQDVSSIDLSGLVAFYETNDSERIPYIKVGEDLFEISRYDINEARKGYNGGHFVDDLYKP